MPGRTITVELRPPRLTYTRHRLASGHCGADRCGTVPAGPAAPCVLMAELGLDGGLRPVHGVLPAVTAAARAGLTVAIVAPGDAAEAVLMPGVPAVPASSLRAVVAWLRRWP